MLALVSFALGKSVGFTKEFVMGRHALDTESEQFFGCGEVKAAEIIEGDIGQQLRVTQIKLQSIRQTLVGL